MYRFEAKGLGTVKEAIMNNRALIGLSAAAMSALVSTAVGCGEPQQKTYTPAEEPAATVEAPATTEAETTETEAAEP